MPLREHGTRSRRREPSFELYVQLIVGYAAAGFCYPWCLLCAVVPLLLFSGTRIDVIAMAFALSGAFVASLVLAMVWAVLGAFVAGMSAIFVHSVRISVHPVSFGFVVGGLIGFFAFGLRSALTARAGFLWFLVLGPLLAMLCCQAGGAWAAQRYLQMLAVAEWRRVWWHEAETVQLSENQIAIEGANWKPMQFSISQLLMLTVWIALFILLLKQCGVDGSWQLMFQFSFCCVAQIVTYLIWQTVNGFIDRSTVYSN